MDGVIDYVPVTMPVKPGASGVALPDERNAKVTLGRGWIVDWFDPSLRSTAHHVHQVHHVHHEYEATLDGLIRKYPDQREQFLAAQRRVIARTEAGLDRLYPRLNALRTTLVAAETG